VNHSAPKLRKFSANNFPIALGPLFHVMKLGALWQCLIHGSGSLSVHFENTAAALMLQGVG
jgi:hypothetical protein